VLRPKISKTAVSTASDCIAAYAATTRDYLLISRGKSHVSPSINVCSPSICSKRTRRSSILSPRAMSKV
jgi:hypothetical protein